MTGVIEVPEDLVALIAFVAGHVQEMTCCWCARC